MLGIQILHVEIFQEIIERILAVHQPSTILTLYDLGLLSDFRYLTDQAFHDILQGYDTLNASELIRNESIFHVCLLERFQGIIYALVLGNELCRAKYLVDREIRLVDPSEQIFQINDSYYIIELLRSHGIYIK